MTEAPTSTVHSWKENGIPGSRLAHLRLVAREVGKPLPENLEDLLPAAAERLEHRTHGPESAIDDELPEARQIICSVCDERVDQGWPACPNSDCPRHDQQGEQAADVILPKLTKAPAPRRRKAA